tara:strand:+ start:8173 stop:8475 length:303 start_codon:yes stop_codon:yes gene_type:complete
MAFGWLLLLPEQLNEFTLREFINAVNGLALRDQQHSRDAWEMARQSTNTLMQPHVKKDSCLTVYKMWPFVWDPKAAPQKVNRSRADYAIRSSKLRNLDNG